MEYYTFFPQVIEAEVTDKRHGFKVCEYRCYQGFKHNLKIARLPFLKMKAEQTEQNLTAKLFFHKMFVENNFQKLVILILEPEKRIAVL